MRAGKMGAVGLTAAVLALGAPGAAMAQDASTGSPDPSFGTVAAVDCLSFTIQSTTFTYDSNDSFASLHGPTMSLDEFRQSLQVGVDVEIPRYSSDPSGTSAFTIVNVAQREEGTETSQAEAEACAGDLSELPRTGAESGALAGALLVAAGSGLIFMTRQRRQGSAL